MDWKRSLLKIVIFATSIMTIGVLSLMIIEGWSFIDALFMTVITISTVGYSEVRPLSTAGRIAIIFIIFGGAGTFIYIISHTAEYFVEGHLAGIIGSRRMKKKLEKLKNHCIICGFGRVGLEVARELKMEGMDFVVIDAKPERIKQATALGYPCIEGDASSDENLKAAGIDKARGLVSAVDSDSANVFITLSARSLNKDIFIVARNEVTESRKKLRAAGADRIISPSGIGGRRLASQLLRPAVDEFLDIVMHSTDTELFMEEIKISENSDFIKHTMVEARKMCVDEANILAVLKQQEGEMKVATSTNTTIAADNILIAIGTREQLKELEKLA